MRGCLFTLLLAAIVGAFVVVVGLPVVAAAVLTGAVQAVGLQASDTTVVVSSEPPTDLLLMQADRVRVRATGATFRGLKIGALDVTLTGVSLLGRTADEVSGMLRAVTVPDVAGQPLGLEAIRLSGGGETVIASTTIAAADARAIVAAEVASLVGISVPPSAIRLEAPDKVTVKAATTVTVTLSVDKDGDLVATVPKAAPVVLIRAGQDIPMRLTSVKVTASGGLELVGTLSIGILG